jgi:hypothetical protein
MGLPVCQNNGAPRPPCWPGARSAGRPRVRRSSGICWCRPQAALGPRSGQAVGRGPWAWPTPGKCRNNRACREPRGWRVRLAAAACAWSSLACSAAMAWAITGCMTSSSFAGPLAGCSMDIVLGGYDSSAALNSPIVAIAKGCCLAEPEPAAVRPQGAAGPATTMTSLSRRSRPRQTKRDQRPHSLAPVEPDAALLNAHRSPEPLLWTAARSHDPGHDAREPPGRGSAPRAGT